MTVLRLWWRTNRRLVLLVSAVAIVTAVAGIAYSMTIACDPALSPYQCERYLNANPPSTALTFVLAVAPLFLGLILGVAAVGGELEQRTAAFAWSVSRSRARWLTERVLVDGVAVVVFGLACGAVNAFIAARLNPEHDIAATFVAYGLWGPIIAVRALCGYAIGLVTGIRSGRTVAAFSVALVLVTVVATAALIMGRAFEPARLIPISDPMTSEAMPVQDGALTPGGRLIPMAECMAAEPSFGADPDASQRNAWEAANCPAGELFLAGSQMPAVELRESAILTVVALVSGALAFKMTSQRRP